MTPRQRQQLRVLEQNLGRWLHSEGYLKRRPTKDWTVWLINFTGSAAKRVPAINRILPRKHMLVVQLFMELSATLVWTADQQAVAEALLAWTKQTDDLTRTLGQYADGVDDNIKRLAQLKRRQGALAKALGREARAVRKVSQSLERSRSAVSRCSEKLPFSLHPQGRLAASNTRTELPFREFNELLRQAGIPPAERALITGRTKKAEDEETKKRVVENMRRANSRRKKDGSSKSKTHKTK